MLKRAPVAAALLLLVVAGFAFGVVQLFRLRLAHGDVYPPYSSLRADPLGAKVLFASLENLPGLSVRRNVRPLSQAGDPRGLTFFYLASHVDEEWDEPARKEFEAIATRGGRLVVTFYPEPKPPRPKKNWNEPVTAERSNDADTPKKTKRPRAEKKKPTDTEPLPTPPKPAKPPRDETFDWEQVLARWGVKFAYANLTIGPDGIAETVTAQRADATSGADRCGWHTALWFDSLAKAWHTEYVRDGRPVVIERKFGAGTLVLVSDSYFLSNEALRAERHTELLAWLVGANRRVIFDELHLGVSEHPGVMALARQYRLHGVFAGFLLLAALFVWKNSVSFVPPYAPPEIAGVHVTGKQSAAGFVNLLRRGLPPRALPPVCLAEWEKSCAHGRADYAPRLAAARALLAAEEARPARERDPLRTFHELGRQLHPKRPG